MAGCNCRGTGAGVVIVGDGGVSVSGAGTASKPFRIATSLADSLVFEVRDSSTVNLTITGSGSVEDPYVLRADTGSVTPLTSLSDVISDAPTAGAVPTWVVANTDTNVPGHWEFQVPVLGGTDGDGTISAAALTGEIPDGSLPSRLRVNASLVGAGVNVNTLVYNGWYRGQGLVNTPPGSYSTGWFWIEVIQHDSSANWIFQRAHSYSGPSGAPTAATSWVRRKQNGTWTSWSQIISLGDVVNGVMDPYFPRYDKFFSITEKMLPFASASGFVNVPATTSNGGGYAGSTTIVYPAGRFQDPPSVTLTAEDNTAGANKVSVVPGSNTTTGCQVWVWRTTSNASYKVHWEARDTRTNND